LINCGRGEAGSPWYHHVNVGTNARLTEFQAAILLCQLDRLEAQTLTRDRNASILNHPLDQVEGLILQRGSNRITRRSYHLYCLRIEEEQFGCSRDKFIQAAQAEGLPITAGYPMPLYRQPVFQHVKGHDYSKYDCPVTEDLCHNSGMWFLHQLLLGSEADMQDIISIVQKIKDNVAELRP
jgi:dTDP-4-amino-4,6-dideoxygalactose transaminase